ncbi:hypothetical protein AAFC00_006149 [Neodothiora populina]|uniref:C3H1-type domain-containing protein n=1 Tax=Neodothiora populina TaxID=2781224 RepID=A0ABR3P491_9PEZI
MSEEAALQARIAALAGRINQQKQSDGSAPTNAYSYSGGHRAAQNRWTPYAQSHSPYPSRGGDGAYQRPSYSAHRNKTLVVNNAAGPPSKTDDSHVTPAADSPGWVSRRDRGHMQLINTNVYDQKMQQKQMDMEETAKQKQRLRNEQEKNKVIRHVHGTTTAQPNSAAAATPRDIVINDLKFRVSTDGSKLIRVFDGSNKDAQSTPKQAKVAGVTFHRSKHGNLYRAGLVKSSMRKTKPAKSVKLCPKFTSTGTRSSITSLASRRLTGRHETNPLLNTVGRPDGQSLTLNAGICPLGPRCRFTHDVSRIAICPHFLRHGECAAGDECNLSHDLTPERVPWCIHFIRGHCTKEDCRFLHVRPSSTAPVCGPFATMGYCEKGAECQGRHVNECPDYANTGVCRKRDCRLPHVDSVANKRRAEAVKVGDSQGSPNAIANDASDLSSDEDDYQEIDSDDVDSDDLDEEDVIMTGSGLQSHELSQQQDFISF